MQVLGLSPPCSGSSFLFTSFSGHLCFLGKGERQICQTWTQTVQLSSKNACGFCLIFLAESHVWLCSCYYNQTLEDVFFINLFFICLFVSLLAHSSSRVLRVRHPYIFSSGRTFWLHTHIVSDAIDLKGLWWQEKTHSCDSWENQDIQRPGRFLWEQTRFSREIQ